MTKGVAGVEKRAKRRFAAFISYAHADAAAAAKLQSKLERYRLPKHIAQTHVGGAAALGQIFRDREDLAAAPSLSEAIRAAIGEAEALVVICSPDAKASRWVGEEISLFRELHPGKPVLAAIINGRPADAFPDALTENGTEPLAADLRAEADGEALGFLKIVAGIAGVPLDALVQRDAQRRIRRVTWITAGALAAMLIMGLMTTLAIQSRNEAARQRAEAEGLVEYMLTDLRDKLRGVGRLDVQSAVNQRMMAFYKRQAHIEDLPADSLQRRARILHALGEDFEKSGEIKLAEQVFQQAHEATAILLTDNPENAELIFSHAQSEYWVGYGAFLNGDLDTAEAKASQYEKMAVKLAKVHSDRIIPQKEIGWAANFWGVLKLYGRNDTESAISYFKQYRDIFSAIVKARPNDTEALRGLSMSHALLAEAYLASGQTNLALQHRQIENDIVAGLYRSDPENANLWMLGIIRNRDIARLLVKKNDYRNAGWYLQQAEEWGQKLGQLDPENAEWRLQSALNLCVRVELDSGREAKSSAQYTAELKKLMDDEDFVQSLFEKDRAYFRGRAKEALANMET
jgi:hypothetical protein